MKYRILLFALVAVSSFGCIQLPEEVTLFPTGEPFVVMGTSTLIETEQGPCPAWIGENGVVYHLFQDRRVENDTFDLITTPGVTSRLEIATRTDLVLDCAQGTTVEVRYVLEVIE
jgi:hypothetical protein